MNSVPAAVQYCVKKNLAFQSHQCIGNGASFDITCYLRCNDPTTTTRSTTTISTTTLPPVNINVCYF